MKLIKDKIPSQNLKEWVPFLLCILAAGIFWFFNALNHDYTADLRYPVRIVYDKDKLIPIAKPPSYIEINTTGYGWNFLRKSLLINQKPVYIKPVGLPKRNYITSGEIYPQFAHQLNDVKINYFIKDTIFLNFEYLSSKEILLQLDTHHLSLAPGHRITGKVSIQPETLHCSGPISLIKSLPDTLLLKLPVETIKGSFDENIPLEGMDPLIKTNVQEAIVKFETKYLERRVGRYKVFKKNFPGNYKLVQDSVTVIYYLDPDEKRFPNDSIRMEADFATRSGSQVKLSAIGFLKYTEGYQVQPYVKIRKSSQR